VPILRRIETLELAKSARIRLFLQRETVRQTSLRTIREVKGAARAEHRPTEVSRGSLVVDQILAGEPGTHLLVLAVRRHKAITWLFDSIKFCYRLVLDNCLLAVADTLPVDAATSRLERR